MQYRKMSEDELKSYYNSCAHRYHVAIEGKGMSVRDCRSERKVLGRSNLIFHLPMAGVLVDKEGHDYDVITTMLPLWTLAKCVWEGFSREADVLLGANVLGDSKSNFKSHIDIVFDPKEAQYIYIRDLNRAPDALLNQAVHYHLGDQNAAEVVNRYNHYVFPLGLSYHMSNLLRGNIKEQYEIERNPHTLKSSRETYRTCLESYFGTLPLVEQSVETAPAPEGSYEAKHYEDDLSCQCSFAFDTLGRLFKPLRSFDKRHFVEATMVATDTWKTVAPDYVVVTYRSSCFSLPAEYAFEQRPEKLSPEQVDRLMMLAKKMQDQRYEKAKTAGMLDYLNTSSDKSAWR